MLQALSPKRAWGRGLGEGDAFDTRWPHRDLRRCPLTPALSPLDGVDGGEGAEAIVAALEFGEQVHARGFASVVTDVIPVLRAPATTGRSALIPERIQAHL